MYGIESYVAVPLFKMNGDYFGTLCALDSESKNLTEDTLETFKLFADLIAYELEFDEQTKMKEEALKLSQQSNEAKARFMSILGHDLRSPLNTIVMAANIQKMGTLPPEKSKEISESILKTAKRMQFLIEDLLDTTQILQGNKIRIEKRKIDLAEVCRQIIRELNFTNPEVRIDFHKDGNFVGQWDEGRIGQVLSNLLNNAITYGDSSRGIKVNLTENTDQVELKVNNSGNPISEEFRGNLFTPFWRGARKKNNSSNLGLGLYIVKKIVESHNGTVEVDSDSENGTTFTVNLQK